jgi:pyruvate kinase
MVARGDLGVEMDLPAVPVEQKRIAKLCRQAGKPCIIATQMLESMTASSSPTRAEVSDVANAELDHADAVMLSGETAVGKYPVETVTMMNDIVQAIQQYHDENDGRANVVLGPHKGSAALAAAAREIIRNEDIKAVAVFSVTGQTPRMLAKNRIPCPILAMSQSVQVLRKTCLYYGVDSLHVDSPPGSDLPELAGKHCLARGLAAKGDKIVVISGQPIGAAGDLNTIVISTL